MFSSRSFLNRTAAILSCLLTASTARAQDFCGGVNSSFQDGEMLRYKVYYNMGRLWAGAGEVTFTVAKAQLGARPVYHIVGDGKTYKSYDWFFKVRDRYESYVDAETMLPLKFVRNVNEGGMRFHNNVTFDHNIGRAVSTKGVYTVPKCIQDVLSAIYYARNIDFNAYKPGAKIPFKMFLDDKVYELYIRYLGKEKVVTRYGTFNAIKFSPLLIEGTMFKGGEGMAVWVSDDANKVPVRIDSPISVGSIKVDLIGYDKLRNAFTGMLSKR